MLCAALQNVRDDAAASGLGLLLWDAYRPQRAVDCFLRWSRQPEDGLTKLYGEARVTGVDEAVALLRTMGPGDAALVKGSRVARLEDVVRAYGETEGAPSLTGAAGAGG